MLHTLRIFTQAFSLFIILFVFLITGSHGVNAQVDSNYSAEDLEALEQLGFDPLAEEIEIISTVEVYDADIQKIEGRTVTANFDLYNEKGIQSEIVYGIRLLKVEQNKIAYLSDFFQSEEEVSLHEGERVPVEFTFTIPDHLDSGEYYAEIEVSNKSGLMLAFGTLDPFVIEDGLDVDRAVIDSFGCIVYVGGEEDTGYFIDDGVDLASTESLFLNCTLVNLVDRDLVLKPKFNTYRRTIGSSDVVSEVDEVDELNMTLNAGEAINFTVEIPKARNPQAYDVGVFFVNEKDVQVSNSVVAHYVLQGESGTIHNVLFNKEYLSINDIAKVEVDFSRSADNFYDSRGETDDFGSVLIEIELTSTVSGNACAQAVSRTFDQSDSSRQIITFPVTEECFDPYLVVKLVNPQTGMILDIYESRITSSDRSLHPDLSTESPKDEDNTNLIIILVLIVILLIISFLFWRKNKDRVNIEYNDSDDSDSGLKGSMMALLLITLFSAGAQNTEAAVVSFGGSNIGAVYAVYSLNDNLFSIGSPLIAEIQGAKVKTCGNNYKGRFIGSVDPNQSGLYTTISDSGIQYSFAPPPPPPPPFDPNIPWWQSPAPDPWWATAFAAPQRIYSFQQRYDQVVAEVNKRSASDKIKNAITESFGIPTAYAGSAFYTSWRGNDDKSFTVQNTWPGPTSFAKFRFEGKVYKKGGLISTRTQYWSISYTIGSASPSVTTELATSPTPVSLVLNSKVRPNGALTTGWFRYSTSPGTCDSSFGIKTADVVPDYGGGSADVSGSLALTGLSPAADYYYCAVAQNADGTTYGAVLGPTATTNDLPTAQISDPTGNIDVFLSTVVDFDSIGSIDPDGGALTAYEWREGDCGTSAPFSGLQTFSKSFAPGVHDIYLRVQDDEGDWSINCPVRTVTVPNAVITVTGTTIPQGATTTDLSVTWLGSNTSVTRSLTRGVSTIANGVAQGGSLVDKGLTPGDYTYSFVDGTGVIGSRTVTVACIGGAVWTPLGCAFSPVIDLSFDSDLIRSGDVADMTLSITSDIGLTCTLYGGITGIHVHVPPAGLGGTVTTKLVTNPLTSAQIVSIECVATDDTLAPFGGGTEARIEVVPTYQEV